MTSYVSSDEYSVEANAGLELSLVGLGQGKCFCSCKGSKRPIQLQDGDVEMTTAQSATRIIQLIGEHSMSDQQAQGILRAADIKPDAKTVNIKQLQKVVDIFHNVLNIKEFPALG